MVSEKGEVLGAIQWNSRVMRAGDMTIPLEEGYNLTTERIDFLQ